MQIFYLLVGISICFLIILTLYRAILGPGIFNRIAAISVIGTKTLILILIFGILYNREPLNDLIRIMLDGREWENVTAIVTRNSDKESIEMPGSADSCIASSSIPVVFPPYEIDGVKYVDGGVSKTIILPKTATVDDLDKILMEYIFDLKGVTVYRDESREEQVYYRLSKKEIEKYIKEGGVSSELAEEDVQCSTGTCEI